MHFSHLNKKGMPQMVDISEKPLSRRSAEAESIVKVPASIRSFMSQDDIITKKGAVFLVAATAGYQAVKNTSMLIPLCHNIPIESCAIDIAFTSETLISIRCTVKTTYKTGIELEAMTGAMIAAAVVYDMCKSLTTDVVICETKLIQKTKEALS